MALPPLILRVVADTKQAQAGMARVQGSALSMSKAATVGAIGAGVALVAFAAKAVSAASDSAEAQNKANETFGDAIGVINDFAASSSQLGIAASEAHDMTAAFGQMFKTAGFAEAKAADMSITMAKLAADMASFNNQDPSEMLQRLQSGLAGQARPLRAFGVFLSDAAIKAQAYKDGIAAVGTELTDAQKVQARYNLILKQTVDQQGDFARTLGESLPNQLRVLSAEFNDLASEMGANLLPTALSVVKGFRAMLPALTEVLARVPQILMAFAAFKTITFLPNLLVSIGAGMQNLGKAGVVAGGAVGRLGIGLAGVAGPLSAVAAGTVLAWSETKRMREEMEAVVSVIEGSYTQALIRNAAAGKDMETATADALVQLGYARQDLPELSEKFRIAASISGEFADAMGESERRTKQVTAEGQRWAGLAKDLTGSTRGIATSVDDWAASTDAATIAIQKNNAAMREAANEQLKLAGGFVGLIAHGRTLEDAQAQVNKIQKHGNTDTRKYRDAVADLVLAQAGLTNAVNEQKEAFISGEGSRKEAIANIRQLAKDAGLGKAATDLLIGSIKKIPPQATTRITMPGMVEAKADVMSLTNLINSMPRHVAIAVQFRALNQPPDFHTGGIFRAPTSGGVGLAVLKDRERIIPAGSREGGSHGDGLGTIVLKLDSRVIAEVQREEWEKAIQRGRRL